MWTICANENELKGAFLFKSIKIWYFANWSRSGTVQAKAPGRSPVSILCKWNRRWKALCPQYEDLRESIRAETITEDTVLLNFLMNSKPRCIAKFYLVPLQDVEFWLLCDLFWVSSRVLLINMYGVTCMPKWAGRIYYVHLFVDICEQCKRKSL